MRKVPVFKLITSLIVVLMIVFSLVPAVGVAASGDEDELTNAPVVYDVAAGDEDELVDTTAASDAKAGDEDELAGSSVGDEDESVSTTVGDEDELADTTAVHFQEGEGESESGSLAGTGIALGIIGFVLLLLAVVAVIGAASLGIIGLGYWQSESGD
jgi:hypothetical protein